MLPYVMKAKCLSVNVNIADCYTSGFPVHSFMFRYLYTSDTTVKHKNIVIYNCPYLPPLKFPPWNMKSTLWNHTLSFLVLMLYHNCNNYLCAHYAALITRAENHHGNPPRNDHVKKIHQIRPGNTYIHVITWLSQSHDYPNHTLNHYTNYVTQSFYHTVNY